MIIQEAIDIEEYLQARNIPYDPPGSKNVGRNHVGISCPFCGDHAYSGDNHLGIKIDTKQWNCWVCAAKGSLLQLIAKLEGCSYRQAEEILKPFTHSDMSLLRNVSDMPLRASQGYFKLPPEAKDELLEPHRRYLESRGFDPDFLQQKYNLKCVGPVGKWKLRIIVPIYFHHRLVSFTSADITRKSRSKYRHCPNDESLLPINQTLYNLDNVKHTIIVVEGITDVWRIGDGAVALYRKHASIQQLRILSNFSRVIIMLDSDANKEAEQLASNLAGFTETEITELDHGDPADLSEQDVKQLRREIFGQ